MGDEAIQRVVLTLGNGDCWRATMPDGSELFVVRRGPRGKDEIIAPAGAVISRVAGDERNLDDLEDQ